MKKLLLMMIILVASVYAIGQKATQAPALSDGGMAISSNSGGLGAVNATNSGDNLNLYAVPSNGSTSQNSRAPSNYWKYQRTEYLVLASEMAACGFPSGSDIHSIGWLLSAAGTGNLTGTLTVWLKNTTDVAYSLGANWTTTGFTQVHSDAAFSVPIVAGYYNVPFNGTTPFTYTGGGVYVAWEFSSTNTAGTFPNTAYCNNTLANSLYGNRSSTAMPTALTVSPFRPATTFGNNALNDIIAVSNIYALGQVATPAGSPTDIRVNMTNSSAASATFNLTITVKDSITGTTRYTSTQTGLSVAANTSSIFTFTGWSPTIPEKVIITATATAAPGETFTFNNTLSVKSLVNSNTFSYNYSVSVPGGWGFNTPPAIFLAKYKMSGSGVVSQAKIFIYSYANNLNGIVYAVVLNNQGTIVAQSPNLTLTSTNQGMFNYFTFPTPPSFCNEEFYVGLAQTTLGTNATPWYPMGAMSETPVRPNSFYTCGISGGVLNMATSAMYCIDAIVSSYSGVCNPTLLTASPASNSQINLTWVPNLSGDQVMIAYSTSSTIGAPVDGTSYPVGSTLPGGGTVIYQGTASSYPHTGLATGTIYYYKAWSLNSSNAYSPPVTASAATYFIVPYTQNFNDGTSLPPSWTGSMYVLANHGTSGSNALTYNLYNTATTCNGYSPNVILSSNPCRLSFDYRLVNWSGYPDTAYTPGLNDKVEIKISTNNGSTWNTLYTINQSNHVPSLSYVTKVFDLSAYSGTAVKIRFQGTWGQGDYYTDIDNFIVEEMPLCTTPTALTATGITSSSATIGWSSANFVEIDYGAVGHAAGTGTIVSPVVTNPYTLTGLYLNTAYDVYVRQDCGSGVYSAWAGPLNFTTLNVISISPPSNNFGSVSVGSVSASQTFTITNNGPATTIESVYLSGTDVTQFTLTDGNTYPKNFPNGSSYTVSVTFNPSSTGSKSAVLNVQEPEQSPYTAALSGTGICPAPSGATVSNVTTTTAQLAWNANGTSAWQIEYGLYGFTQGTGTMITTGVTNPYTLSGLTPGFSYSFYVRSNCNGGFSGWAGPVSWTQLCNPYTIPYSENFDATTVPNLPLCWIRYNATVAWQTNAGTGIGAHSTPNFVGTFYNSSLPKNDWMVSPPTNVVAGVSYQLKFWVKAPGWAGVGEKMKIVMSTSNALASLQSAPVIWNNTNMQYTAYTQITVPFTAATSGVYYFGWYAYSIADLDYIAVDDVVFEVIPVSVSGTVSNVTCNGSCNGTITTTVSGGTAPYTYLWSDGATTGNRTQLCAGSYTVSVTDALLSTTTGSWTVTQPAVLSASATVTNSTCYLANNGSISVVVSGGTSPYTYLWNNGVTSASIGSLAPGNYALSVTDSHQCTYTNSWTITEPQQITVGGITANVSCFGLCDGSISTTVNPGGEYSYNWTGPNVFTAISPSISNLCAGSYFVTVTNTNQCTAVNQFTVTQPGSLSVSGTVTDATCPGSPDGSIITSVTGGTTPYTYQWSTGSTASGLTGLLPGTYSLTVYDAHGCPATNSWTVNMINAICANISVIGTINSLPAVCYNATNTITVAGSGMVYEVSGSGRATFIAGSKISYLPGTKVYGGGYMRGYIAPNGPWCNSSKLTEVSGQEEQPAVTERANFNLYPNPTNGNFTLVQKGEKTYNSIKVEIFSMNGEKVLVRQMIGQQHEFNFSGMAGGIYFVKVIADGYVETIKLVKTR